MTTMKIQADAVREGDSIPGLDNGYVIEVEDNSSGYLCYPRTGSGMDAAMPDATVLISFHDSLGNECYLILPSDCTVTVERQ